MYRFEHRRTFLLRIQICRWGNPYRYHNRWAEIRENVSKQVGAHDNVEPVRVLHEMGGEYVDVILIRANIGILFRDLVKTLVPKRHGVNDAVRLGRRRNVLLAASRELKCI